MTTYRLVWRDENGTCPTVKLVAVEEAFRNLKQDLAICPVFHQDECRIEAHIFLAYCL